MKPKIENRAMQAILRYGETRQEVERLTDEIAFELGQCPQEADYPKRPHLIEAYTATTTEDHYGGHQSGRRLTGRRIPRRNREQRDLWALPKGPHPDPTAQEGSDPARSRQGNHHQTWPRAP